MNKSAPWTIITTFLVLSPFFALAALAAIIWVGLEAGWWWGYAKGCRLLGQPTDSELREAALEKFRKRA